MSSITEEDLAKIMRPGLRVVPGKDWQKLSNYPKRSVDENGDGEGTITKVSVGGGVCYVKWDHDQDSSELNCYYQGFKDMYFLKLAEPKNLAKRLFKAK